ncbi:hypothetical protein [Chryseobacterium fistulae]|uniref:Uncharacterized protein n=1 Tax=Chryseobacterium fistulae TaxID=2675058 RepID=A0A6N4XU05_9FLAO|nr:hypothetical protein [Chryseobacterium fistulae]CAA7392070.1 hypothetical protein CHRY9393_03033 [Chryseobacterium fistulae]
MQTNKKPTTRNNKGLQKLTESETKINSVLSLKKITEKDLEILDEAERVKLYQVMTDKFNELRGDDRDDFYEKIEAVTAPESKNQLWELNHNSIIWGISAFINEYGRMPSKTEIATKTELSRQTVHKHLKEYQNNSLYLENQQQFQFMQSKVLARVFQFAINGDIKACRLYLECTGGLKNTSSGNTGSNINNNTLIQNQNNYIQIGGTILNQEIIQNLKPEQISTIEGILKTFEMKETD